MLHLSLLPMETTYRFDAGGAQACGCQSSLGPVRRCCFHGSACLRAVLS